MTNDTPEQPSPAPRRIRWWPAILVLVATAIAIAWVRAQTDWPFQKRNLVSAPILLAAGVLLILWWTFLSRVRWRLRLTILFGVVGLLALGVALFRIRGVSGDLVPILEFRFAKSTLTAQPAEMPATSALRLQRFDASTNSFPQFYGPNRNGVLPGPRLETNWSVHPPTILWRQKVGAAWSGFAIVGDICLTQEQRGEDECVVAYQLSNGKQLWLHSDKAHYNTTIAGEGPRATPTVVSNRVFTCGGTGILNCFDLATGKLLWMHDVVKESGGKVPGWGFASSPLVVDGLVIIHSADNSGHLLSAFHAEDGKTAWTGGKGNSGYASPALATLAGARQVLAFTRPTISGYDPATGKTLWEFPWQSSDVVCAMPVVAASNQVVFSSAYGFGAKLIELSPEMDGKLAAKQLWKSIRMKAKFAHIFVRDGCLFGLDDGMFACVDLKDGSQRWKEGRYGHGQGLVVGDLYLLMAESGELVLLRPTPDAPNELARFRVFHSKTWNPIALSGDLLLTRNDLGAACVRLKTAP